MHSPYTSELELGPCRSISRCMQSLLLVPPIPDPSEADIDWGGLGLSGWQRWEFAGTANAQWCMHRISIGTKMHQG